MHRHSPPRHDAAEVLATLGLASARTGQTSIARARIIECLGLLQGTRSREIGAAALHAAAELAASLGQPGRAVELHAARLRILRESRGASVTPPDSLHVLQSAIGAHQFQAAWQASEEAAHPLEFYINAVLQWLETLETEPGSSDRFSNIPAPSPAVPSSTAVLVSRAQDGDSGARERLASRYIDALRRFAHGRLPRRARDLMDTNDLVQVSMVRGMGRLDSVQVRKKGDFFAYLRQIVLNLVRDEVRRSSRKHRIDERGDWRGPDPSSPLEDVLEKEALEIFTKGLDKLTPVQRTALELRLNQGVPYEQVAAATNCPTPNAARMVVTRALADLTKSIQES